MCFICPILGLHEPKLRPGEPKLKDWIDDEEDKTREAIWNKIRKNMYKYYLGNNVEFASFRKAAEFLFNRDYKNKKQIFVPEVFLTKLPEMILNDKKQVEELLKSMNDDGLSAEEKKEKEKLKCRLKTIEGEVIEKKVYDTLKAYYESHSDQEVLVIHGYEIADLEKLAGRKDISHWEKDFLIINKTYGYIMNIEAKSSLIGKTLNEAKAQLENTRMILEKWFGADLKEGWKFISAIYCERNDKTNKNCKEKMDFIFTGTEDLKEKIGKIHESLQDESRFD
jgi:hypothetical protein